MRDFTTDVFASLLDALNAAEHIALPFVSSIRNESGPEERTVLLRHDVDRLPWNAVRTAELEAARGMLGTYYFRIVKGAWDPKAIRVIADLGHECGYHYEDMDLAGGDKAKALDLFEEHLGRLREIVPVHTICMHGSPLSKWDNRDLWTADGDSVGQSDSGTGRQCDRQAGDGEPESGGRRAESGDRKTEAGGQRTENGGRRAEAQTHGLASSPSHRRTVAPSYREYGIIGEPYFDVDFSEVGYITDTGRSWNNREASIRDKVDSPFDFRFRNTFELIEAIREGKMPKKLMITIHPQRWNDAWIPWSTELVGQNVKNVVKRMLVVSRRRGGRGTK